MARCHPRLWLPILVLLLGSVAAFLRTNHQPAARESTSPAIELTDGMVRLRGGPFDMGNPRPAEADQRPIHRVQLDPFWLDATPVTNRQFRKFVEQTQFKTSAQRRGRSLVFDRETGSWREMPGAEWTHPDGPDSSLAGKEDYPVVQVSWFDAVVYAAWAGKRLPTEAEYEYAARGGLSDCPYPWGRELTPAGEYLANFRQGGLPQRDHGADGFRSRSPVRNFPANRWGFFDMAGNVWNWCADWYASDYYGQSLPPNPRGPTSGPGRVRRGGSWLSTANLNGSLRVGHRDHASPGEATNHTGFRCARSIAPTVVK